MTKNEQFKSIEKRLSELENIKRRIENLEDADFCIRKVVTALLKYLNLEIKHIPSTPAQTIVVKISKESESK
jgi:hypothetical protein